MFVTIKRASLLRRKKSFDRAATFLLFVGADLFLFSNREVDGGAVGLRLLPADDLCRVGAKFSGHCHATFAHLAKCHQIYNVTR
jgi:hypothetical protein